MQKQGPKKNSEGAPSSSRLVRLPCRERRRRDGVFDLHSASRKSESQNPPVSPGPSPVSPCAPCGESVSEVDREFQAPAARVKSNIRKILLTSPTFPRLYADLVLRYAPNSREAKILRPHYQKICERVNAMSAKGTCTHLKVTGVRCCSPALGGEQFCYFPPERHPRRTPTRVSRACIP
jgi:hypothetical protein